MGQNQSSKAPPSSNYGPRPPPQSKKNAPAPFHDAKKHGSPRTGKSKHKDSPSSGQVHHTSHALGERSSSVSHSSRPPPAPLPVTRPVSVHSPSERSAPFRQFSLTRQTSDSSTVGSQIERYFNKYRDGGEDAILAEGMEQFCVDLGVDPTEFVVLVLAWKFEASQMCRFTREEFLNGCRKMRAHDARSLKDRFPDLLSEARSNFKDLYVFTFSFGLDHSSGQRSLPIDMAVPLWQLVFSQHKPALLGSWFEFLQTSDVRGISRDTWNMFLPFSSSVVPDFSNYDDSEAWPSLFDDFVEHELTKQQH